MKIVVSIIFSSLVWNHSFSQDLTGEWNGDFTTSTGLNAKPTRIKLIFVKLNDSVYKAFSKTYLAESDSVVCIMEGGFVSKNKLVLNEFQLLQKGNNVADTLCLQQMELNYSKRKKRTFLSGYWSTLENRCGSGTITVYKTN